MCRTGINSASLTGIICILIDIVLSVVPLLLALALLVFFWGMAQFILNAGNEEEIKKGKARMVWGILGLFLIFSIAGIITVLMQTFILV
jgi:hypothetical protein